MKNVLFILLTAFLGTLAFAQEETRNIDVNINTRSENWYASPWIWVVGAAIFILLLVALTRGKRS